MYFSFCYLHLERKTDKSRVFHFHDNLINIRKYCMLKMKYMFGTPKDLSFKKCFNKLSTMRRI